MEETNGTFDLKNTGYELGAKIRLIMGRFYNSVNKRNVEAWAALAFELFHMEQLWPWSQH